MSDYIIEPVNKQNKKSSFGKRKYFNIDGNMNRNFSLGKSKGGKQQWVHPSEALLRGHIVYNVKFLGNVEVEHPKGTEMVRDAIRKMKFNKQLKKAEGQKPPKVELTISVDGVTVQEPKYKVIEHQYPLHRISYCADDKSDKRMFTFIAKESSSNKHHCFVFDSDKCAEEITLTIGQAFNLAYKKFMDTSSKDIDVKKQFLLMQKKVQTLTTENLGLKERVADLERLIDPQTLENFDLNKRNSLFPKGCRPPSLLIEIETTPSSAAASSAPSADTSAAPVVGRKLENLLFDDAPPPPTPPRPATNGGTATTPSGVPVLAPPPPVPSRANAPRTPQQKSTDSGDVDLFGQTPFTPPSNAAPQQAPPPTNPFAAQVPNQGAQQGGADPFGMGSFLPAPHDLDRQIMNMDQELLDLQTGFSQGLSFGTEDFSLQDLDPLNSSHSTVVAH